MQPSYFSEVVLGRLSPDDVRRFYVEWLLGVKRFAALGGRRRDSGIHSSWPMKEVHEGGIFVGDHEARLDTRRDGDLYLARLSHRDSSFPAVLWHTVIRISGDDSGTVLQHGAARSAPRGEYLEPIAAPPGVIGRLLDWNGAATRPKNLGDTKVIRAGADAAFETARHLVADRNRGVPMLILSTGQTGSPAIDDQRLAHRLVGMARVLRLTEPTAAREFSKGLETCGLSYRLGVGGGAARLLHVGLAADDNPFDHPLWTADDLYELGDSVDEVLAGEVVESVILRSRRRGFFRSIEQFDRESGTRRAAALLSASEEAASDPAAQLEMLEELRTELNTAQETIRQLSEENRGWVHETDEAEHRRNAALEEVKQVKDELRKAEVKAESLQRAMDGRRGSGDLDGELREAATAIATGDTPTPLQCLVLLHALYPDRLDVMAEAYESARAAAGYRHGRHLWELLVKLAVNYYNALVAGKGDGEAKSIFGNDSFAAKESESTMKNPACKRARERVYKDATVCMWKHLKRGVADSTEETIRVHFHWFPQHGTSGVLVIGHCGEHLPIVGKMR